MIGRQDFFALVAMSLFIVGFFFMADVAIFELASLKAG